VAVVLAGGGPNDRLARSVGAPSKALVPLAGAPLAAYVLTALRRSGVVARIVLVGPDAPQLRGLHDVAVPAGTRLVDSLALGLGAGLGAGGERLLVLSADVPWWTAEGVRAFVAEAPEADLVYPVVREEDALLAFPDQRRTYARLRDGRFTAGNAVLMRRECIAALLPWIDRAYAARKRPWQLAGIVGLDLLVQLVAGRASLAGIEARVRELVGIDARVFVSRDAAIAADVDAPEHLVATPGLPRLGEVGA
jgi:molybdopterin-guanine dinucleotide biosynthesis protein A